MEGIHAGYCRDELKNQVVKDSDDDTGCQCRPRKNHADKCRYRKQLRALVREFTQTPVIGYNSGKYDMTFVINAIDKATALTLSDKTIRNGCGYMKVQLGNYQFLDAMNFVPPGTSLRKFADMWQVKDMDKELFPYDWFDSAEKLQSPGLPARADFYSRLHDATPSQADYDEACAKFRALGFTTFQQYMEHYCRRDVDLLLQGMNNYRELFWATSQLEILNFVSIPQLAYTDFLATYVDHERHPLHYIPNEDVFGVVNESLYGGNCQVFRKHSRIDKDDELILSLDENNLYGHSTTDA